MDVALALRVQLMLQVGDYVFNNFDARWSGAPPTVQPGGTGSS